MSNLMPVELIENKILMIRSQKVMIDRDLAELYEVQTKVLNQAVNRNINRFPNDFMFQLTCDEKNRLVTICDRFRILKHSSSLPYAFTEQGVAMLSSVLRSERAVQVNIAIMRAFVKLRKFLLTHHDLAQKLNRVSSTVERHDVEIGLVFKFIKKMIAPTSKRKKMGFLK